MIADKEPSVRPTMSDCCKAPIEFDVELGGALFRYTEDRCSACNQAINYAIAGPEYDGGSPGVCWLFDGSMWFFEKQTSSWKHVRDGQYIGQVKEVVDTPGRRYGMDNDNISYENHKKFSDQYKGQVRNPEWALR